MFANRYTAFADACVLMSARKRNLLLTLARAEFFRVRWSAQVLVETEKAVAAYLAKKGDPEAASKAANACAAMESAFEDAMVSDFAHYECTCEGKLPDPKDIHVVAAALKTRADVVVTENLRHFPAEVLAEFNLEARSADTFIADTISLDEGRAVAAIAKMRARLTRPDMTAERLLLSLEEEALAQTANILRAHVGSL